MTDRKASAEDEKRLRRIAVTRSTHQKPEPPPDQAEPEDTDDNPARRAEMQTLWVDGQIRRAMERGEFDNLPLHGKPIPGLDGPHDPGWWIKNLIHREQLTGLGPDGPRLRREDADLDAVLDKVSTEADVRRILADFNARVVVARRQLRGGPPVTTKPRDVDREVAAWRTRRAERQARQRARPQTTGERALDDGASASAARRRRRRLRWWARS
jgi:Domain of unknown function (DUF1992)